MFIIVTDRSNIMFCSDLDNYLDDIIGNLQLDKLKRVPVVYDKEFPNYVPGEHNQPVILSSTIGYCIKTPNNILFITCEKWSDYTNFDNILIHIRSGDYYSLFQYFTNNKNIADAARNTIIDEYNYHCGLLARSLVKSAKSIN